MAPPGLFYKQFFASSLEEATSRYEALVTKSKLADGSIGIVTAREDEHKDGVSKFTVKTFTVKNKLSHQRAQAEITVASRLSHPLVPEYCACVRGADGLLHLVMKTHEGCSGLFDLVHKSNGLDEALVKHIVAQVICVLHYLHQKLHLVYVDLKPENLLVQADGKTIVLVDYDLCRSLIDPDSQLNPRRTAAAAPGVTTPLTPGVTPLTPSASAPATPAGGTPATPGPTGSGGSAPAQSGAAVTIMNGHHNSSPQQATSTAAVVQEGLGKLSLQNGDASSTNGHASATNSSSAPAPSTPGAPLPPHPSLSSPVPTPGSVTAMVNGSEEQGKGMRRSVTIPSFEATSMVIQGVDTQGAQQPHFWGTLEYIAPEVIDKGAAAHGCASDWWALGVLTYELLYARSPFRGPTQERTMYNITMKAVDFPASLRVSSKAKAFMRSLLRQRVEFRLGSNCGITEIMSNPWFEGIDWTTVPGFDPELMPPIGAQAGTPSAGAGASAPGQ